MITREWNGMMNEIYLSKENEWNGMELNNLDWIF